MIKICHHHEQSPQTWQSEFIEILPELDRRLHLAFCRLNEEARDDAVQEGLVHALLTYVRLFEKERTNAVSASSLAWFSAKQVKRGRPAVGRMNSWEPLSRYAQLGRGIKIERLYTGSATHDRWIDKLVEDKRASVVDQVSARMDISAWFNTLSRRTRWIAKDLAHGCSTSEVAARYGVTPGRISQLRRELHDAWRMFQGELTPVTK